MLNYRRSIYFEMAVLLIICVFISGVFFLLINLGVEKILDIYADKIDYTHSQSQYYADSLQEFVTENEVSSKTLPQILNWTRANPIVILQIYGDEHLIFDSLNDPYDEEYYFNDPIETPALNSYFPLELTDMQAKAWISGSFEYARNNTLLVIEVVLTFLLFITIFWLGMRIKIEYIRKLQEEVELLSSGNLDYRITVKGMDELASLAQELDLMRRSFSRQIAEAEALAQTNSTIVTQMSHDLRTPLTAIMLYADILHSGAAISAEQKEEYLDKILKKIGQMKDLSEHMLTYSTAPSLKPEIELIQAKQTVYDELSDLCGYLAEQGFETVTDIDWDDVSIRANEETLYRVFNNISSNIMKYADREEPVHIHGSRHEKGYMLEFTNSIAETKPGTPSSGIGIKSITDAMRIMHGSCETENDGKHFSIKLYFST